MTKMIVTIHYSSKHVIMKQGNFWLVRGMNEGRKSLNLDILCVKHFLGVVKIGV